jgi:acetyl esterase/lipase
MQMTRIDPAWVKLFATSDVHYRVPGMQDVRVRRNLLAGRDVGEPLSFDLYIANSRQAASFAPVVVLIHGGPISPDWATTPRQWRAFQSIGELLAASGLNAVLFDHRFHRREETDPAMDDIELVLNHIGANAAELGVDASRICLWAFSRGGIFLARYLRDPQASLRCLVAFYAALDADRPELSSACQIEASAGRLPPTLVAAASFEEVQGFKEGLSRFVNAALRKNLPLDLMIHAGGRHGFDVLDDDERTRDILGRTIIFIQNHLGPP